MASTRAAMLARLEEHQGPWDIVIIGGGATGVGIAVDAASRGYSALLLEQSDFGKGTSSRSTKLVHGGVRYLEQGNISLVMEALKERGILRQNAPHLVSNLPFVVPNYDWWETPFYGIGLKVYNLLAGKYGLRRFVHSLARGDAAAAADDQDRRAARRRRLLRRAVRRLAAADQSRADRGRAGRDAVELRAGDRIDQGGRRLRRRRGRARRSSPAVEFRAAGASRHQCHGPVRGQCPAPRGSAGARADRAEPGDPPGLRRSFLPGESAIMVPHTRDGRVMFAIPWHGHTLVGTTDTPIGEPSLEPTAQEIEIAFVLETAALYLHKRADACRRPQRLRRHSSAGADRGQPDHRGAVARPHDPHRRVGAAHDGGRQVDDLSPHGRGRGGPGDRVRTTA